MSELRVAVVGLGYFSQFHRAAWAKQAGVRLVAVCDRDAARAEEVGAEMGVSSYGDFAVMLAAETPDIVDIVAPPVAHEELVTAALGRVKLIICQKPFCPSITEAEALTAKAEAAGTPVIIHENFRFQPWYRDIKDFLDSGRMGQVWQARFTLRPGDGRGPDAYLSRQPTFQKMPRLLIYETAVHLFDVFRWLFGPIEGIYADLRRHNPVIAGEDAAIVAMIHEGGTRSTFDGNRLSDQVADDPRRTMGPMEIEGEGGLLVLDGEGVVRFRPFGETSLAPIPDQRTPDLTTFAGGCVAALIAHAVEAMAGQRPFENTARDYLTIMRLCEAAYQSDREGRRVQMT